jgi:hypothetical protein
MSLIEQLQNGEFLPPSMILPLPILDFSGQDSETSYQKNLKSQPLDWYYRDNPIFYHINSRGYRTSEFNLIDWSNSIVIFGCSNVFGVGLHNEDTLSSQLNSITDKPVINMGAGGTSMEFSLFNSIILNKHYPTPKAIIQIWATYNRTSYYLPQYVENLGIWQRSKYYRAYVTEPSHSETHGLMAHLISRGIWEGKTKYYEASFSPDTAKLLKIPFFEIVDKARDLLHPGRTTIKMLANAIKTELNL